MRHAPVSPSMGRWIIRLLLVALCVRALVPAGFMPATDRPFSFQICPEGFPAALLNRSPVADEHAHHHHANRDAPAPAEEQGTGEHQHTGARAEHCVFAVAASAGPVPETFVVSASPVAQTQPVAEESLSVFTSQRFQRPQSRAPPALT